MIFPVAAAAAGHGWADTSTTSAAQLAASPAADTVAPIHTRRKAALPSGDPTAVRFSLIFITGPC